MAKGVIDGHMDEPGTPTVGTRCLTTRRIGGANRPSTFEVTYINHPPPGASAALTDRSEPPSTSPSNPHQATNPPDHLRRLHRPRHRQTTRPTFVRREAAKEMPVNLAALKQRLERR
jgi:hypothetical protein